MAPWNSVASRTAATSNMSPRLIAALPAYNEEECLPPLVQAFAELFKTLPPGTNPIIIVVDDGSKDRTADVARELAKKYPVKLIQHQGNKGLGEAIKTGLRGALAESTSPDDIIICMDADDTHPPSYVVEMLKHTQAGADIVIASRYRKGSKQIGVPLHRQAMSLGALLLFKVFLGLRGVRDFTCGFRAYRAGLITRGFAKYGDDIITRNGFACTDQLLVNLVCLGGVSIKEIPFVLRYDRKVGPSKLNLGVTIGETMKLLVDGRRKLKQAKII